MEKLTIYHYFTQALEEIDPPTDWEDILDFVLATLNATCRPKYYTTELTKALNVGLRFGIIRGMNNKYYLYEYAKINSLGEITYEFTGNPQSPSRCINKDEKDENDEEEDKDENENENEDGDKEVQKFSVQNDIEVEKSTEARANP